MRLPLFCCILSVGVSIFIFNATAQTLAFPQPIDPADPKGLKLPSGVPRTVDTNGNVIFIDSSFTTRQYRHAATLLAAAEATRVAQALQLPELLPITESNLTAISITPFGFNYVNKGIGSISTSNYVYYFTKENKFDKVVAAQYDSYCLNLAKVRLPKNSIAYNPAMEIATQWLASASIDVSRLQRECRAHIALSPYWNGVQRLGQEPKKDIVPIYYIWWTSSENERDGYGGVARVEVFLPERKLLQLSVDDPKYILREPLMFKDLNPLFPGTGKIDIFTNYPSATNINLNQRR